MLSYNTEYTKMSYLLQYCSDITKMSYRNTVLIFIFYLRTIAEEVTMIRAPFG